MFKELHLLVKIPLLLSFYAVLGIGEWFLYHYSLSVESVSLQIVLTFIQCWWLILVGFLFFQIFKYFRLPKFFYRQRFYETDLLFKVLGLNLFRFILINSFFKLLNPRVYLKGRGKKYFRTFHAETEQSETSHLFSMLATLVPQIYFLIEFEYVLFWSLTLWSILFNLYPMMLQRKNRFIMEEKNPELFRDNNTESSS